MHQLDNEDCSHAQGEYRKGEQEEEVAHAGADESYCRRVIEENQGELTPGEADQVGHQTKVCTLKASQLGHTKEEIEKVSIQKARHPQVEG